MTTLQSLNTIFTQALDFAKVNPIIASAGGLWGLSVLTYLVRDIPSKIIAFIVRHSTTTMTINNQDPAYYQMLKWLSENKMHRFVRAINVNNGYKVSSAYRSDEEAAVSFGYGVAYFLHDKKIFILKRYKDGANQSELVKEVLDLTVISRDRKIFSTLLELATKIDESDANKYTEINTWDNRNGYWRTIKQYKRDPASVVLCDKVENELNASLEAFKTSKPLYLKHGVAYKLGILLQGPPGTGKTSLIKIICAKQSWPLYVVSLAGIDDNRLVTILNSIPAKSVIAIEDIDGFGLNLNREEKSPGASKLFEITMSGLLNALDGVVSPEDRIIIATTNHPDRLDPALIRSGRFDLHLTLDNITPTVFKKYMSRMYPDFLIPETFLLLTGVSTADIQKLVFSNKDAPDAVLKALDMSEENVQIARKRIGNE